MSNEKKILIIEDDQDIVDLVEIHINDLGFKLDSEGDGISGLEKFQENEYDLLILDLMLPKLDGIEVCKKIRMENTYTPILMLTAKSEELDKVLGLELGADDYLTKPFSVRELIARIKAIFRRLEADKEKANYIKQDVLKFNDLVIFLKKRKVMLADKYVELTSKEFDLLTQFAGNPGRAYSRQELLDLVWGYQFEGYDHTVNSHINRLRNKIEKNVAEPKFIQTVWGIGYRFIEPEELEE